MDEDSLALPHPPPSEEPSRLKAAGLVANQLAAKTSFSDYRQRKSAQTLRRQDADLRLFTTFLADIGLTSGDLSTDPTAWQDITWGLFAGYVQWQIKMGYAVSSINIRLSTAKNYAKLAMQAGSLSAKEYAQIKAVRGYSHKEGVRLDQNREQKRRGKKKAAAVAITTEQAGALKSQPDTPQGRRDAILMCLLLDHGLRAGEVARLDVSDFDLKNGLLRFFRPKVQKVQTHRLTKDTQRALMSYSKQGDMQALGPLLRESRKSGALGQSGMSERAISMRVEVLGEAIGITGLSAHDCRHYWASTAAKKGTDPFVLQEAGGWSSLAMPRRYVEDAKIANDGVKLD